jgi:hypothetical protein
MSEYNTGFQDPIPNQDEEFDGEEWDQHPELIPFLARFYGQGFSFRDWVDYMAPLWQAQLEQQRKRGFFRG